MQSNQYLRTIKLKFEIEIVIEFPALKYQDEFSQQNIAKDPGKHTDLMNKS